MWYGRQAQATSEKAGSENKFLQLHILRLLGVRPRYIIWRKPLFAVGVSVWRWRTVGLSTPGPGWAARLQPHSERICDIDGMKTHKKAYVNTGGSGNIPTAPFRQRDSMKLEKADMHLDKHQQATRWGEA
ncbi:hypothetical protein CIHG_10295 [Coccidioides immitis H538.4]|uniref:Uncharacterized protein n=2 Tax=Coccidioides immitis TaxID=5501 RepID=A0A0J8S4S4_COCIT|nr:hypothetical protein CIRG_05028 [Coccidioides immitis RMSCC 2394]KMU92445.1 hypothetical protein CIHG_10295 [Coccidioides immitis H538.4]